MQLTTRRLSAATRPDRPATDRAASPEPDAADGRAAIPDPMPTRRTIVSQIWAFATIGVLSTIAYVILYGSLRAVVSAAIANAMALIATAVGNTAANRRLTFGVTGHTTLLRDHAAGLAAFGVALAMTTGAIGLLDLLAPTAGRAAEILVLVAANGLATVVRFVVLRSWLSRPRPTRPSTFDHLEGSLS
jgi:putative flippase GtrA